MFSGGVPPPGSRDVEEWIVPQKLGRRGEGRSYITQHLLRAHGATRGCEGCVAVMRRVWRRKHTEPCQDRFMKVREDWCHRKRKLEEEAKQQEDDAKRQKQEEDERKFAAKTCGDDPRLVGLGGKVW